MSLAPGTKKYGYAVRETTQWEDILVEKEILEPDQKLVAQKAALEEARQRGEVTGPTNRERIEKAKGDLDELDELEDDVANDDDEERMLAKFRAARIAEMKKEALKARFGTIETLARDEFIPKVKIASTNGGVDGKPMFVIVELYREGLERSALTSKAISELAERHPDVKFVRMVSDQCIQGWPDSRVPSIIVYFNGEMKEQLIGLPECGNGKVQNLARILWQCGVLPKPDEDDEGESQQRRRGSEDEDW